MKTIGGIFPLFCLILISILYGCGDLGEPKDFSIGLPNSDQIKSDLIKQKLGTWTFANLSEFQDLEIEGNELSNGNQKLVMYCSANLIDYNTFEKYKGNLIISYSATLDSKWKFESVEGKVTAVNSERENDEALESDSYLDENTASIEEEALEVPESRIAPDENIYEEQKFPICEWCGNEIKSKKYYINSKKVENYDMYKGFGKTYHQNCAYEKIGVN
jgi:RNA polymerase-binding transcription factor DksA